jgi:hypothetical protein
MLFDSSFNPGFARACAKYRHELSIADSLPQCTPAVAAAQRSELPVIETVGDLADWLCLSIPELEWFADLKQAPSFANRAPALSLPHPAQTFGRRSA